MLIRHPPRKGKRPQLIEGPRLDGLGMWCLSHKSQCSCKANTPRGALNACAPRRAGTNAAVRRVNDLEVSAAPPLAGFLAAKSQHLFRAASPWLVRLRNVRWARSPSKKASAPEGAEFLNS